MKDIVFATNNAHKLRELREIARDKLGMYLPNERVYIDISK